MEVDDFIIAGGDGGEYGDHDVEDIIAVAA